MSKKFPISVVEGNVTVKVYRQASKTASDGYGYLVSWQKPGGGRYRVSYADLDKARDEAMLKAKQLARGIVEAQHITLSDMEELAAIRLIARRQGVPAVAAMEEWDKSRTIAGGAVIEACTSWAKTRRPVELPRILLGGVHDRGKDKEEEGAIDIFCGAGEKDKTEAERTYRSKLNSLLASVGNVYVDTITLAQFEKWLRSIGDGVTRNDYRKRALALFRWLQQQGYLPEDKRLELERTKRVKEEPSEIGTITPTVFARALEFIATKHPRHLTALVLNGGLGMRAVEVHGKNPKKGVYRQTMPRQKWEDISLEARHLNVSVAKEGTPAWRYVPITAAAYEWLSLVPVEQRTGPVCLAGALQQVRRHCLAAGIQLPNNCFRHSYISHRIGFAKDKGACADDCGTSVKEIDRRYRRPTLPEVGKAWFRVRPHGAPAMLAVRPCEYELPAHSASTIPAPSPGT